MHSLNEIETLQKNGVSLLDTIAHLRIFLKWWMMVNGSVLFIASGFLWETVCWIHPPFLLYNDDDLLRVAFWVFFPQIAFTFVCLYFFWIHLRKVPRMLGREAFRAIFKNYGKHDRYLLNNLPSLPRNGVFDSGVGMLYGIPSHQALVLLLIFSENFPMNPQTRKIILSNGLYQAAFEDGTITAFKKIKL